jgi:hypothetical protein
MAARRILLLLSWLASLAGGLVHAALMYQVLGKNYRFD